jgi:hypothetical protein
MVLVGVTLDQSDGRVGSVKDGCAGTMAHTATEGNIDSNWHAKKERAALGCWPTYAKAAGLSACLFPSGDRSTPPPSSHG